MQKLIRSSLLVDGEVSINDIIVYVLWNPPVEMSNGASLNIAFGLVKSGDGGER